MLKATNILLVRSMKDTGPPERQASVRNLKCGILDSIFALWVACAQPTLPAAIHGFDVGIAHFLNVICGQRRTESSTAVENQFGRGVGTRCSMSRSMTPLPK